MRLLPSAKATAETQDVDQLTEEETYTQFFCGQQVTDGFMGIRPNVIAVILRGGCVS
jgi:hypothetical protein